LSDNSNTAFLERSKNQPNLNQESSLWQSHLPMTGALLPKPMGVPMRIDVEFTSRGATLRGWLFQPEVELAPAVIMAHGFSATRSMVIDKYAEAFYAAGFTVLLYDHRGFGASDGDPPRQVNPWLQARGYLDAVAFLSKLDGVDPDRISVWGDSLSAGVACVAATIDERIGAVVAQVPAFGASEPPADKDGKLFQAMRHMVLSPDVLGFGGPVQGPLPVVSSDQVRHPSALKPLTAFRWFVEYGGALGSNWVNDVALSLEGWQPGLCAPYLKQPVLMLVSPKDEMARANPRIVRKIFDSLCGPKEWYAIGGGHFGVLYHPSELFSESRAIQVGFLRRWADRPAQCNRSPEFVRAEDLRASTSP
jgi:pimeloyl-ACP methyl ester carboxylesterase